LILSGIGNQCHEDINEGFLGGGFLPPFFKLIPFFRFQIIQLGIKSFWQVTD